jgi:hypothetical protein
MYRHLARIVLVLCVVSFYYMNISQIVNAEGTNSKQESDETFTVINDTDKPEDIFLEEPGTDWAQYSLFPVVIGIEEVQSIPAHSLRPFNLEKIKGITVRNPKFPQVNNPIVKVEKGGVYKVSELQTGKKLEASKKLVTTK